MDRTFGAKAFAELVKRTGFSDSSWLFEMRGRLEHVAREKQRRSGRVRGQRDVVERRHSKECLDITLMWVRLGCVAQKYQRMDSALHDLRSEHKVAAEWSGCDQAHRCEAGVACEQLSGVLGCHEIQLFQRGLVVTGQA